jgi:hypothetical protein
MWTYVKKRTRDALMVAVSSGGLPSSYVLYKKIGYRLRDENSGG